MPVEKRGALTRTLFFGIISVFLYLLLYAYEDEVLALSRQGGWNFIVPMAIAFVFSIVHGNFTGQFWDLFGIRAKTTKK
jgi:hypothetical protein